MLDAFLKPFGLSVNLDALSLFSLGRRTTRSGLTSELSTFLSFLQLGLESGQFGIFLFECIGMPLVTFLLAELLLLSVDP